VTQFASIDHHDVPWRAGQKIETYPAISQDYTMVTRPNFQHNPPNPILVEARIRGDFKGMLRYLRRGTFFPDAPEDRREHAQKVLTRLANLTNDKEN
jgi:hypothetical protein